MLQVSQLSYVLARDRSGVVRKEGPAIRDCLREDSLRETSPAHTLEDLAPRELGRAVPAEPARIGKDGVDECVRSLIDLPLRERPQIDESGPPRQGFRKAGLSQKASRAGEHETSPAVRPIDLVLDRQHQWVAASLHL